MRKCQDVISALVQDDCVSKIYFTSIIFKTVNSFSGQLLFLKWDGLGEWRWRFTCHNHILPAVACFLVDKLQASWKKICIHQFYTVFISNGRNKPLPSPSNPIIQTFFLLINVHCNSEKRLGFELYKPLSPLTLVLSLKMFCLHQDVWKWGLLSGKLDSNLNLINNTYKHS